MMAMKTQTVEAYNEAHLVFLFDGSFRDEVQRTDPVLFEGGKPFEARLFQSLFDESRLIIYELYQDDSAVVRVVEDGVPDDLSGPVRLLPPEVAGLRIPSGRLHIETLNTLHPLEAGDKPGVAAVAPGEYVVTLHRVDWPSAGIEHYSEIGWIETVVLAKPERPREVPAGRFVNRH